MSLKKRCEEHDDPCASTASQKPVHQSLQDEVRKKRDVKVWGLGVMLT